VGDEAWGLAHGAQTRGLAASRQIHLASPEDAGKWLKDHLVEGDVVLLKGSRGVHLERVWEQLGSMMDVNAPEAAEADRGRKQVSV